jgi:hypothetical protein
MLGWIMAVVTGVVPMSLALSFNVVRIAATVVVMPMAVIVTMGFGLYACFDRCCLHDWRMGHNVERNRQQKRHRSERCECETDQAAIVLVPHPAPMPPTTLTKG